MNSFDSTSKIIGIKKDCESQSFLVARSGIEPETSGL